MAAIVIAVRAIEEKEAIIESKRAIERERKQRNRAKSRDGHGTVTGLSADNAGPLPKEKVSPTPPSKTQPLPFPPSPPTGAHGSKLNGHRPDFDRWYRVYPIHKKPRDAERAFLAALNRGATVESLIAVAERYSRETASRPRDKVLYPASWLNSDSWLDEAEHSTMPSRARHEPLPLPGREEDRLALLNSILDES
jgi:hypothetical protein